MSSGPWWLVALAVVMCLYAGWRAYLHHRWPTEQPFDENKL